MPNYQAYQEDIERIAAQSRNYQHQKGKQPGFYKKQFHKIYAIIALFMMLPFIAFVLTPIVHYIQTNNNFTIGQLLQATFGNIITFGFILTIVLLSIKHMTDLYVDGAKEYVEVLSIQKKMSKPTRKKLSPKPIVELKLRHHIPEIANHTFTLLQSAVPGLKVGDKILLIDDPQKPKRKSLPRPDGQVYIKA